MKINQLLLAMGTLLFLIACGNEKNPHDGKKKTSINQDQIDNLLEHQSFECASIGGGRCPGGIARVFILDLKVPANSRTCTGFLTETNILVTNHHCLSTTKECDSTYVSVYNGESIETAKCYKIIKAFDDGLPLTDKAIDYAVIELDRHIRSSDVFKLSSTASTRGETLTAWVVDHLDLFNGRITELSCIVSSRGNSIKLRNCPAISGNSGSPVVNRLGQIEGVLWGSTTGDSINEETSLRIRRSLSESAYVTELKHFIPFLK